MTTPEAKIRLALYQAVEDLAVSGLNTSTQVAWPNVSFNPPDDHIYVSVQFEPNVPERIGIGELERLSGLLMINVFWSKNGGERLAVERASLIADQFPTDRLISADGYRVRITQRSTVSGMMEQDAFIQVPVTVWWEAYI